MRWPDTSFSELRTEGAVDTDKELARLCPGRWCKWGYGLNSALGDLGMIPVDFAEEEGCKASTLNDSAVLVIWWNRTCGGASPNFYAKVKGVS